MCARGETHPCAHLQLTWRPLRRFAGGKTGYPGPTTPCTTAKGYMPRNQPGMGEGEP